MPKFTVIFKNNSSKILEAASKDILIRDFSMADATAFQEDVKEIRWEEENCLCVESIASGKISRIESK
ncbi:hypothetical protein [Marivirga harenae]|uniref:hypothetical protein n=1 Tax=Marivirga harenae TaxID=2010992 RepID=UPI0026DED596|nr:hypothetical protein [Marivirga harenae]WKV13614.1 hypothetical protein Q3Y49_07205 [Marivirga harenae]|tara:strand:+ start:256335 stop:256538 length:204 start_codon:yes stop_codon:yes gene_type:complete